MDVSYGFFHSDCIVIVGLVTPAFLYYTSCTYELIISLNQPY